MTRRQFATLLCLAPLARAARSLSSFQTETFQAVAIARRGPTITFTFSRQDGTTARFTVTERVDLSEGFPRIVQTNGRRYLPDGRAVEIESFELVYDTSGRPVAGWQDVTYSP